MEPSLRERRAAVYARSRGASTPQRWPAATFGVLLLASLLSCEPPAEPSAVAPAQADAEPFDRQPVAVESSPPEAVPEVPALPPPDPAALAPEIQAAEAAWASALVARDVAALDRLLAAEFTITGVGSTADDPVGNKAEWLENAQRYPWPPHAVLDPRVVSVTPDVALIKCLWRGTYPPESLTPQGGELTFLMTDLWVRRDGRWQVAARHSSLPAAD